jgi:hypothetical protein
VRRIGVLMYLAADDAEGQARLAAFTHALKPIGLERRPQTLTGLIADGTRGRPTRVIRGEIQTCWKPFPSVTVYQSFHFLTRARARLGDGQVN